MNKKRILQLICLVIFLAAGRQIILYLIEPADYSLFFNKILEKKAARDNGHLDMVFLGTSRSHRTFDPDVFEKELGLDSVFNASSGLQPVQGSYYLLKELIDRYHPDYVVLDVTAGTLGNQSATLEKVIVLDRLHGINKLSYLMNGFTPDEYLNAVSRCYRFRNNFTAEKIRDIVGEKKQLKADGYAERISYPDRYTESGFIYSYLTGEIENLPASADFDWNQNDPVNMEYLEKIITLCEQNNIRLFLVTTPWSLMQVFCVRNYQDFVDHMSDYASMHNLSYFNLNYLRGREEWLGDDMMYDNGHVNGEGADRVSEKYAQVIRAILDGDPIPDIFYHDISELRADVSRIIALQASIQITDMTADVHITSVQSEEITPLYRISLSDHDDDYVPLADWSEQTDFQLDISAYQDTVHFLIEAMSLTGEPGSAIKYHVPVSTPDE